MHILLIGAGILGYFVYHNLRIAKRVAETPTSKIGELRQGAAEIQGRVRAMHEKRECPVTGRPCVYYRFKVEQRKRRFTGEKFGETYWVNVLDDQRFAPFEVEDDTGAAEVDASTAKFVLYADEHEQTGFFDSASPEFERALKRYGRSSKVLIFNKTMRYSATVLEEGDQVYVLGEAQRQNDGRFRFTKSFGPFVVSDMSERALVSHYRKIAGAFGFFFVLISAISLMIVTGVIDVSASGREGRVEREEPVAYEAHDESRPTPSESVEGEAYDEERSSASDEPVKGEVSSEESFSDL